MTTQSPASSDDDLVSGRKILVVIEDIPSLCNSGNDIQSYPEEGNKSPNSKFYKKKRSVYPLYLDN